MNVGYQCKTQVLVCYSGVEKNLMSCPMTKQTSEIHIAQQLLIEIEVWYKSVAYIVRLQKSGQISKNDIYACVILCFTLHAIHLVNKEIR